ncbi:MAG TPA: methionyl-tRNA formyltransferase [Candidatus Binatia bacterium]|jgi:methionyl-tRNA formyltransferase
MTTHLAWVADRPPRSVFMGTPAFAVPSLEALAACTELVGVVTRPDKPRGRGLASEPSPVAAAATARRVPLVRPATLRDTDALATLASWRPDLLVVAAYGRILPASLLALPTVAPINVHASLLPRHRGAAPIAAALLAGDRQIGITIMLMAEQLDAGDVLLQRPLDIGPDDTTGVLTERLAALGGIALRDAVRALGAGGLDPLPQDPAAVTYAPRLTKADGLIAWSEPAELIARKVRAFAPWPSAFTRLDGRVFKILSARAAAAPAGAPPGTVTALGETIRVATGDGALDLLVVQAEGKRALAAKAFIAGARLAAGTRFDG